jgi:hypothetical protein
LGIRTRHYSSNPPLYGHPRRCAGTVQDDRCHSPTLCHPLPPFLHAAPLEREQRRPRGAYVHQPSAHPGRHRDARRAEHVLSVTSDPVRPSPAPCRHPGRCGAIPDTVGPMLTGRRHASRCAAQAPSSARPSNRCTNDDQTWVPAGLLGNSGKPVILETLSLTNFLRHVFQGQGTHDFRKPGTCEASNSRMCEVRESWFGEVMGSRTCGSPESRAGDGANVGRWPIWESVKDPVRELHAKTCTNR